MKQFTIDFDGKESLKHYVSICGFRGCHAQKDIGKLIGRMKMIERDEELSALQLFDADRIATHLHLLVSVFCALHAFRFSKNISKTIGTETLLYASAQRQIIDAIDKVGVQLLSHNIAVVAVSQGHENMVALMRKVNQNLGGEMDDSVLDVAEQGKAEIVKKTFGLTEVEIEAARIGTNRKDIESTIRNRVVSKISVMGISK
ncbi:MAG: KEOPS complex subunit Cgi121 [Candidatus Atabeyarchaeum deiterrae]